MTVLYYGLIGLALLVVLWPTVRGGQRFLQRWGVSAPTEEQSLQARRYLLDRRLLYPPLFLLAPLIGPPFLDTGTARTWMPLVVALLVAETIAALRRVRGPRVASLHRRSWRDLLPRWSVALMLGLAATALLLVLAGLFAQPWLNQVAAEVSADGVWRSPDGVATMKMSESSVAEIRQPGWLLPVAGVTVGLAAVLGVVRLAVRRGSVTDLEVDAVLRMRSARVAVGIGIAWMASMIIVANNRLGFVRSLHLTEPYFPPRPAWLEYTSFTEFLGLLVLFVAAAGWIWVANPPRHVQKSVV